MIAVADVDSKLPPLGFVGLGGMGRRMAARLVAHGYEVHGYDVQSQAVEGARASGVLPCAELATLANRTDRVLLSLPDSTVAESVVFGENGLARHMSSGTLIVDLSSGSPKWITSAVERLAASGGRIVDVPVSGGFPGAEAGTLTLMAGGSDEDVDEVRALTAPLGELTHLGGPGSGHLAKALNNALYACALCISAESLVVAKLWGLDATRVLDVWTRSSGRNGALDGRIKGNVLVRDFTGAMSARLMLKDIRHAIELGTDVGLDMDWAKRSGEQFEELIARAGAEVVDFAVVTVWEDRAKVLIE